MFKIPPTTSFLGITYNTEYMDNKEERGTGILLGDIDHFNAKIRLLKDVNPDVLCKTYCHEGLHGIADLMGVRGKKVDIDDDFIDLMAGFIHQWMDSVVNHNCVVKDETK